MTEIAEALPEQVYSYQPTDENGVNMGGPQVIKYKTMEELVQKLQENNVRMQRKLREANRKNKTGQQDVEEIPETAKRFQDPIEFKPRALSADELIEISSGMGDPTKVESSFDRLTQAKFGASPEQVRNAITASQQAAIDNKIRIEVDKFIYNTPGYYICQENWNTIYNWMTRYNLEPIEENFVMAFQRLSAADILLTSGGTVPGGAQHAPVAPPVQHVPAYAPPVEQIDPTGGEMRIEEQEQPPVEIVNFDPSVSVPPPAPVQRVSTSLTNGNTSSATPVAPVLGADIKYVSPAIYNNKGQLTNPPREFYGLKALDAMPPEEYQRRFNTEPGFKEKVNKMLTTRKVNPNQR
jgi:hypothetical protein